MEIPRNVGAVDRVIRIVVGAVLVLFAALAFAGAASSWGGVGLVGLSILLTGALRHCPTYWLLGISTAKDCLPDG
jgi:hypothetical protein